MGGDHASKRHRTLQVFHLDPVVDLDKRVGFLNEFLKQSDRRMSQRGMTLGKRRALCVQVHAGGYQTAAFYTQYHLWKRRVPPRMRLQALVVSTDELADVEIIVAILIEIIKGRHGKRFTPFNSQVPASKTYEVIREQTTVDAVSGGIVHDAHRLEISGASL